MSALVLSMLRARWGQAVTVFVLAFLATAAAAAAPLYVTAIDRAVVAGEVAHAAPAELSLHVSGTIDRSQNGDIANDFEKTAADRVSLPGFVGVYSTEFLAMPSSLTAAGSDQLRPVAFREGLCDHVVVVAGRCLMGGGETVLTVSTAKRYGLSVGDRVSSWATEYAGAGTVFVPAGQPWTMTVVGLVRPRNPAELYWGGSTSAAPDDVQSSGDPMYVARPTFDGIDHPSEVRTFDSYASGDGFTLEHLGAIRAWTDQTPAGWATSIPDLLDRIARSRTAARQTVPLAAVSVVVLAWAVIMYAVTVGARARRHEFGIVALRGVPKPARWWLAAGETVIAVLAGAPVGLLVGWLVVRAVAPARPVIDGPAFTYAGVAVLGALLTGLIVQVRTVSAPVVALLREIDRRTARVRSVLFDALVIVLAVVVSVNTRGVGTASLSGLPAIAPALIVAAVALLAARGLPPLAAAVADRSLRRGRLTAALTALRLTRRPAGQRLLVILVVALGTLAFAGLATSAASQRQDRQAALAAGATTVLTVAPVTRDQLLDATRRADPSGRLAMAVVPVPATDDGLPPSLAVDSSRLAAVALWPGGNTEQVASLAGRLRQPSRAPLTVTGTGVDLDATATDLAGTAPRLTALVAPAGGGERVTLRFGALALGRHTYHADSPACAHGCRLVDLEVDLPPYVGKTVRLTLHTLGGQPITGWRAPAGATATPGADGQAVSLPTSSLRADGQLRPPDVPDRLSALTTGALPSDGLQATFGEPVSASPIGTVPSLPRLGTSGTLVDLADADLVATDTGLTSSGEVWLSAATPPSLVDRLTASGLVVTDRRTVDDERAVLARQGSALALQFYLLAGALSVVLGAAGLVVTTVTESRGDLWRLRSQGLPARVIRRVDAGTPVAVVLAALPVGIVGGAVAWVVVGSGWPGPWRPLWIVLAAGVVLGVTAFLTTRRRPVENR
jgi:putative ABC transport system permease protein